MRKIAILTIVVFTFLGCSKPVISLMSFNIRYDNTNDQENWWGHRKEDVVAHIKMQKPDFLGIQEGLHHQVQHLSKQLPSFHFVGHGRDDGKEKGEYSAIFYQHQKFKLLKTITFWLSTTPDTVSVGWDAALPRIVTYGSFESKRNGKQIHVFNAHFDHLGKVARERSAELILEKIKEFGLEHEKVVVMGDLNSVPGENPIKLLKEQLHDGFSVSKFDSGPEGTFNGFKKDTVSNKRIDYIFTKNLKQRKYKHIDTKRPNGLWVSDHLAVYVEVFF